MADDFSASASAQKPHRHTPFDDILSLEKEQEERLRRETAALEAKERSEHEGLREREQKRTDEVRAKAREEFTRFKQHELPAQLKAAEEAAAAERTRIEKSAAAKKGAVVQSLVERMLSSDTLSRL